MTDQTDPRHVLDGIAEHSARTTEGAGTVTVLGEYDGHDVLGATVSIRNTGHGLEEAMDVEPVKLPLKSRVHIVLECEVEKHRYDPVKDTDGYRLVNMLKAGRATIVDAELVEKHLDEQQRRIDEARGEPQLPLGEDVDGAEGSELDGVLDVLDAAEAEGGDGDE